MAKYAVLFPVSPRVEAEFTKEQIELAARIAFWQQPAPENMIHPQKLILEWSEEHLGPEGGKFIRIMGEVIPPGAPAEDHLGPL